MKPFRVAVMVCALAGWISLAEPAAGAWNNVFQVTCNHCQRGSAYRAAPAVAFSSPVVAYSAPAVVQPAPVVAASPCCPQPCCPQTCTTNYVQRCYYQPVTTYQTQTYYEAVTSYQTQTYYEPVTSYSYSCYYDPCTCTTQQVAIPQTSYVMRQKCCPVQSWVQRCASVPVTSYQKSCYWEPRTTCCSTTVGAPVVAPAVAVPTVPAVPAQPAVPAVTAPVPAQPAPVVPNAPPQIQEQRVAPAPVAPPSVNEQRYSPQPQPPTIERYYGNQGQSTEPPSYRQPSLQGPTQPSSTYQTLPPAVKLNQIAQGPDTQVQGLVLASNNTPKGNVQMVFVHAKQRTSQQFVTTSASGRFHVSLTPGSWLVYVRGTDGRQTYHSRIEVNNRTAPYLTLVSR